MSLVRTAYILVWFPKPSETFVFREVANLQRMGLPLRVFTLFGKRTRNLSAEMRDASLHVERLGTRYLRTVASDIVCWWRRNPKVVRHLMRTVPLRRWNGLVKGAENLWAFLCAFRLARRFEEAGIGHIHAPWASGPATAAWVASTLTGIPFTFTARAWDIYPPDGALKEKIRDATLVRCETAANIRHLAQFTGGDVSKFHLTYNGVPLRACREASVPMKPPYKLLALGRFMGKKGYDYLLRACKTLRDAGVDFQLTLAGDGPRRGQLKRLARRLGIRDRVIFPGFVSYDAVPELFAAHDIFLMPSVVHSSGDRDGIPTVIMEALMHRVPVIATNVSGIPELVEDRVTGRLIPEKDSTAIAKAVQEMLRDRDGSLRMAEKGRSKVWERFDPDRNHRQVLQLYEKFFPSPSTT